MQKSEGCWLWAGAPNKGSGGYGFFWYQGKQHLAHRVSWAFAHGGQLPSDQVLHKCDVPLCVRPDHLFLGTHQDNMADMARKGRHAFTGKRPPNVRLTDDDVRLIRSLKPTHYARELAEMFDVCMGTIYGVWEGVTWTHVAD